MQFPKNYCLVEIDEKQNLKKKIQTADGEKELILDVEHNRIEDNFIPEDDSYIPHKGTVVSLPRSIDRRSMKYGITTDQLKPGDKVYVHHLAVNSERRLTNGQYFLSIPRDLVGSITSNFIAKVCDDGQIKTLYDWNLFEPVVNKYEHSTLVIPDYLKQKKREDILKITHLSSFNKDQGNTRGDRFIVKENSTYPIQIEGKKYIALRDENILCKIL